jgi:hypothetical protein
MAGLSELKPNQPIKLTGGHEVGLEIEVAPGRRHLREVQALRQ